jgi:hypothetical protein
MPRSPLLLEPRVHVLSTEEDTPTDLGDRWALAARSEAADGGGRDTEELGQVVYREQEPGVGRFGWRCWCRPLEVLDQCDEPLHPVRKVMHH